MKARDLIAAAEVWEMTLPLLPMYWEIDTLARYHRAGYAFVSATLQDWPPTFDGMVACIERFEQLASAHADWLTFGHSLAAIDAGRREGKLVIGLNSQETRPIGDDRSRIEALRALGVRHMLLAYQVRNLVADGCAEPADAGLSNFGRQVVREMNRVGIVVDCSHTGYRSSLEAIELSDHPAIFSHSGAHAVYPHLRNVRDDQIRACAETGGVVGVLGLGGFLGAAEVRAETMFRHIDHMVSLVGAEHVGLGTDYVPYYPMKDHAAKWETLAGEKTWPDPANAWPGLGDGQPAPGDCGCFQPEQLVDLVELMLAHGYVVDAVTGILGGNFRRVYAATE